MIFFQGSTVVISSISSGHYITVVWKFFKSSWVFVYTCRWLIELKKCFSCLAWFWDHQAKLSKPAKHDVHSGEVYVGCLIPLVGSRPFVFWGTRIPQDYRIIRSIYRFVAHPFHHHHPSYIDGAVRSSRDIIFVRYLMEFNLSVEEDISLHHWWCME